MTRSRYIRFITRDPAAPFPLVEIPRSEISDREASLVGSWWNEVGRYLEEGPAGSDLEMFAGHTVGGWELETRGSVLEDLELFHPEWFSEGPYEELG